MTINYYDDFKFWANAALYDTDKSWKHDLVMDHLEQARQSLLNAPKFTNDKAFTVYKSIMDILRRDGLCERITNEDYDNLRQQMTVLA